MTTKQVFISYKREDRPRVKELAENLRDGGSSVWFDESIQVGDHWWDTILDQIENCDVFVFAISQRAFRSEPCKREREYAAALGKPILLIRAGLVTAVPPEFSSIQYDDFSRGDKSALIKLIGGINRLPSGQPNAPGAVRPPVPIAPLEEIAAILDTQPEMEFIDQLAILYRLKASVSAPADRKRALELVGRLLKMTQFVQIQEEARTLIAANKPAPINRTILPSIGFVVTLAVVLGIAWIAIGPKGSGPTATTAVGALPILSQTPTETRITDAAATPVRVTELPTLNIEQIVASQDAAEQVTAFFNQISTVTLWTRPPTITYTPTPDLNASAIVFRTQRAVTTTAQFHTNQTATATRWTRTPTPTRTATSTPTPTSSVTSSPTPTLIPARTTLTLTVYARTTIKDMSFVYVPRGCFVMGSDKNEDRTAGTDVQPRHEVCLTQGYYIGEFEVTNAQFEAYEQATGKKRADVRDSCISASSAPNQPVVCVSWEEANAFTATWLEPSCGLPMEAQWEYAARSPASLIYPWGNTFDKSKTNTFDSGPGKTAPVGQYAGDQSWVGARDMAGNVWEWVNDWYSDSYYAQLVKDDPTGPSTGSARSLRGGSWFYGSDRARAAARENYNPNNRYFSGGFRVVCSAPIL